MKINVSDLTKIMQSYDAEGIDVVDITPSGIKGSAVTGDTETFLTVEFITKGDSTPGLRVSKNEVTKTVVLDEGK